MLANGPCEEKRPKFFSGWLAFGNNLQLLAFQFSRVAGLHEQPATDLPVLQAANVLSTANAKNSQVLPRTQNLNSACFVFRRYDYFSEDLTHRPGGRFAYWAIGSDYAAECRGGISNQGLSISLLGCFAQSNTSGIRMLDDRAGRLIKIPNELPGRVGVDVVIKRHLLTGEQIRVRDPAAPDLIQSRLLVWVFSVTQVSQFLRNEEPAFWQILVVFTEVRAETFHCKSTAASNADSDTMAG